MTKALVVPAIVSTLLLLLLSVPAFAANKVTVDLTLALGGGTLEDNHRFGLEAVALEITGVKQPVSVNKGRISIDGERTKCTIEAEPDCSAATLTCEDLTAHVLVPADPGVSKGSLDGVEVKQGFISLKCGGR